jgi:hypothetical protein
MLKNSLNFQNYTKNKIKLKSYKIDRHTRGGSFNAAAAVRRVDRGARLRGDLSRRIFPRNGHRARRAFFSDGGGDGDGCSAGWCAG